jgi:hypothetical protein
VPALRPESEYVIPVVVTVVESTEDGVGVTTVHVLSTPLETELLVPQQIAGVVVNPFALTAPLSTAVVPVISDGESVIAVGLPAMKFRMDPFVVPVEFVAKILK